MKLQELTVSLCSLMSVSGHEFRSDKKLTELVGQYFDEYYTDAMHNHVFVKRSKKMNAPRILIDTHYDEIGMMVTNISDNGFVSIAPMGGVDTRILQSCEVIIYGREEVYGVVGSTSPHLQTAAEYEKLKPMEELYVDTGMDGEELKKLIRLGDPVGFKPIYTPLKNNAIAGKSFDDKAPAACAIYALANTPAEELAGDVYLVLSSQEELGCRGARTGAFGFYPDYALVMDVTHAYTPDTSVRRAIKMGSGITVCYSAVTDRSLTDMAVELCKNNDIKYNLEASPNNTGTNANVIGIASDGIPTVLVSLPIKSMHSPAEAMSMDDAQEMVRFTKCFVTSEKTAEVFAQ